ncbi:polyamine-modulated factor 1-binding protein 1 isoform X3 [Crotalus tigris]|uniref:polyamine-modulated factor 1-binding protein 1 isoform X3 n=1 Tax=Crotalus tigris TaxID=88082 RepID=UPI00192F389D|nr:polyamine-modulated factor 1-binding protein 1 isoform X3 [Crotalus tigris]
MKMDAVFQTEKLAHGQKDCKRNPEMETGSARSVEQEQARLHGNSVEGQTVWSGLQDTWLQLQQSKAVTQEQERERSLQIERDWHMREQLRQAEISVHVLESSLDLYKKKYQAALGRVGELESQMQHREEEAGRKAARCAKKLDNLWSSGQAEDGLGQLNAREMGWALQLTGQQDQTTQELQEQLAVSHDKSRLLRWALSQLLQQKEAVASLHREFASYKLTHSCSNAKYKKQMISQAVLHQKLQQAEKEGLQQQAEAYWALVQELKLELAREAELNSKTLKDLARLELAVQSLCQEAATEQNWQLRELAVLQHHACPVQALLGQSHQLCTQKEWKPDRLLQRAWTNCSIFWDRAHVLNATSQEAKQCRAVSWPGVTPVLQPRRPKSLEQFQKAAMEVAQEQRLESNLEPQRLGKVGCPLEVLLGGGCLAEAKLEQKSFLGGGGSPAAAISGRELLKELMEELSRSKRQPLQAASMLELELLRQQETEWRVQGLKACVMEQKAENYSLQEQLTKHMAVLGLVHGHFRQARLQLQHQAEEQIESLQISLEASRAGHHWLHQESELVLANVRQWVKEQKQMNEELGHKLRMQIKQIAQLTGERDLLHQLLERLQEDNQQLKNEVNEKRIICERIKALHNNDLEPQAVLRQLWHILLL